MTLHRNLELSSYHLNRADRIHLFQMFEFGKDSTRPPVVTIQRSGTGWSLTFDHDCPPGTRIGFNSTKGIFASYLWNLMDDRIARLDIHEDGAVDRDLPIYNPHTDDVVDHRDFDGSFEIPTFEALADRAMEQVSKYPQYKREMFDGWKVGRADIDVESRMGLSILKGEYTLFLEGDDDCRFWSFQNAITTGAYPGMFSEVSMGSYMRP